MAPSDEGQALHIAEQMVNACGSLGPMSNAGGQGALTPPSTGLGPYVNPLTLFKHGLKGNNAGGLGIQVTAYNDWQLGPAC